MRRLMLLLFVPLLACRPPASVTRDTPIDFGALTTSTFSDETKLAERWAGPLKQAFESGEKIHFDGVDGVQINAVIHRVTNAKGAIVFIPGRTEPVMKYAELIADLNGAGYSTYAIDLRGQGSSGRMLPNPSKGYVASFSDYVTDLETFIERFVKPDAPRKLILMTHSLGGAVAVLYADAHPDDVDAMVLNAPMLEINTGSFAPIIASSLASTACSATDGSGYAIGSADYSPPVDFSKDTVTSSQARWEFKRQIVAEHPELALGGVTWRWLCESLTASSAASALGRYSAVPTLIIQAGQDTVVRPRGQDRYCGDAPRCQITTMAEAKHEMLSERDTIRNVVLSRALAFLTVRTGP